jgi:hypothetical protein
MGRSASPGLKPNGGPHQSQRARPLPAEPARPEVRLWLAAALAPRGTHRPHARATNRAHQIVGASVRQQRPTHEALRGQQQPLERATHERPRSTAARMTSIGGG